MKSGRTELKIAILIITFMALSSAAYALTISGVNVINITDTSAVVRWQTDVLANGVVNYGTNRSSLSSTANQPSFTIFNAVQLSGLAQATTYYFDISATDQQGNTAYNNANGNYFSFTTTLPLFVNITPIPAYVNTDNIDVVGTTRAGAQISVFINGVLERFGTSSTGSFSFYNVPITQNGQNLVNITATAAGESTSIEFTVTSDTVDPVITFSIPAAGGGVVQDTIYSKSTSVRIQGTVSETSNVTITVEGQQQYSQSTNSFAADLILVDGENEVVIEAIDQAGNGASRILNIIVDSVPPTISQIAPTHNSLIYENFAKEATIRGTTEPGANVRLFINRTPCQQGQLGQACAPDYTTTADSDGEFEFRRIDITKTVTGISLIQVPVGAQEGQPTPSYRLGLNFQVTDLVGNVGTTNVEYNVGTCFSSDPFWTVRLRWWAPPLISTERLQAGTEQISMVVEFNYTGIGQNPKLSVPNIKPQCSASQEWIRNDPKYNWSCRIVSQSPAVTQSNNAKTKYYWLFNLGRLPGADQWTSSDFTRWYSQINGKMDFPFLISYSYTHEIDGAVKSGQGSACFASSYTVDNVRVAPKKFLSDHILAESIKDINKTITEINNFQKNYVQPLTDYVGYACLATWGLHTLNKVGRIWRCAKDKAQTDDEECKKCMVDGKVPGQNQLSNACLNACYPRCESNWDDEGTAYTRFRYACDRIFAHNAPARRTESLATAEISEQVERSKGCGNADTALGASLVRSSQSCRDYSQPAERLESNCYVKGGFHYRVAFSDEEDSKCDKIGKTLIRIDKGRRQIEKRGAIGDLKICAAETTGGFIVARPDDCKALCGRFGYDSGKSNEGEKPGAPGTCNDQTIDGRVTAGTGFGYTLDTIDENKQCCCYPKIGKPALTNVYPLGNEPEKDTAASQVVTVASKVPYAESAPENEWNYRYAQIKYGGGIYNPERYYAGRDKPACFGQNSWYSSETKVQLNPNTNFVHTVQCGALGTFNARLNSFKAIAGGLQRCLTQIRTTGQANAAMCKQLFTVYLCGSIVELITYIKNKAFGINPCDPTTRTVELRAETPSLISIAAVYQAVDESVKQFNEEYDNAAIQNYLGGGVEQLARKACVGAFFHDWDISARGFLSAAYGTPTESFIISTAPPNKREFVTINPVTSQARYSYTTSWMISPGCDITSYAVQLSCVSQREIASEGESVGEGFATGTPGAGVDCNRVQCDCAQQTSERTTTLFQGGGLKQNQVEENGVQSKLLEAPFRYDHAKIILNIDPRIKSQCLPPEHADGVYYFPLRDAQTDIQYCTLEAATGTFSCTLKEQLFDKEGEALIQKVRINGVDAKDDIIIFRDDGLTPELEIAQYRGEPKCIMYDMLNSAGGSDLGGVRIWPIGVEGNGKYELERLPLVISTLPAAVTLNGLIIGPGSIYPTLSIPPISIVVEDGPDADTSYGTGSNDDVLTINSARKTNAEWRLADGQIHVVVSGANLILQGSFTPTAPQTLPASGTITVIPQGSVGQRDQKTLKVTLLNLKGDAKGLFDDIEDCDINSPVYFRGNIQSREYRIDARALKPEAGGQNPVITNEAFTGGTNNLLTNPSMKTTDPMTVLANVKAQGTNKIVEVYFEHKSSSASQWTKLKLDLLGSDTYFKAFPAGTITMPGSYQFRITAKDDKGNGQEIPGIVVTVS